MKISINYKDINNIPHPFLDITDERYDKGSAHGIYDTSRFIGF